MDLAHFFLRWIHFLGGFTWVGVLYYFNFIQTPFFAETEAPVRVGVIQKLLPRALWWFRWGAMVTFVAGLLMYFMEWGRGGEIFFRQQYGIVISLGGLMGTIMFLNVWLVIWPSQQVVMASIRQAAAGGQAFPNAASAGRRAALVSRTNTVFSIPMLFFMAAARHYPSLVSANPSLRLFWILSLILIAAVELNALVGTQGAMKKPLDSVTGALQFGFALWVVLYLLCLALL